MGKTNCSNWSWSAKLRIHDVFRRRRTEKQRNRVRVGRADTLNAVMDIAKIERSGESEGIAIETESETETEIAIGRETASEIERINIGDTETDPEIGTEIGSAEIKIDIAIGEDTATEIEAAIRIRDINEADTAIRARAVRTAKDEMMLWPLRLFTSDGIWQWQMTELYIFLTRVLSEIII